jgi:hypothetical protein
MSRVEIAVPAEPISVIIRHQLEARAVAAREQEERAIAACDTAKQYVLEELAICDTLGRLFGTAIPYVLKRWEFATADWHTAEQAVISKRRVYDILNCLLEAGAGHVFSAAIITEHDGIVPYCRHCRAVAGLIGARRRCTGDAHRCSRSVRPGESDTAVTVPSRRDLLCGQRGTMSPDFTSWTCALKHCTDWSHADSHLGHLVAHCSPATCPWPYLIVPS